MSWKPSRSSGLMFDKFDKKAEEAENNYIQMLKNNDYIYFKNLNKFSKYLYLYWLNLNKKNSALCGRSFDKNNQRYSLDVCAKFPFVLPLLNRNIELIYKPLQEILKNENI